MEVTLFPNPRRPGIGLKPKRESQRPLLPQHARHCPVLEAGSSVGFMVYPSLGEHELFQVGYEGEGKYRLDYSANPTGRKWEAVFSVVYQLAMGGIGARKDEVELHIPDTPESREAARMMARMFIAPDDLGTPAGAVTLRGSYNFQTPPGWDTVYTPVFNNIERPVAPMMVIRVETDWYVHDSEFRYVLQPGETISVSHNLPVGQVMFVPREEVTFREGTQAEIEARFESNEAFFTEKAASKIKTPYGFEYSPLYQRTSRRRGGSADTGGSEAASNPAPPPPPASVAKAPAAASTGTPAASASCPVSAPAGSKVGRNDPCPCGSGKKYKKCHGENA